jgi:hypothetical protein
MEPMATFKKELYMPKGTEEHRSGKKKAKFTLKERRQMKREKKQRDREEHNIPSTDINF